MTRALTLLVLLVALPAQADTLRIGSKRFTESYILGEVLRRAVGKAPVGTRSRPRLRGDRRRQDRRHGRLLHRREDRALRLARAGGRQEIFSGLRGRAPLPARCADALSRSLARSRGARGPDRRAQDD